MPRNNGWLAILAVSVVLSILRNSLAGERYPLNYGNPELQVNRSKSVRVHRDSNRPSLSTQYYTRDHGGWSPNPIIPKDASKQIPKIPKTTKPYSRNEYRRSNDDPSIQPVQIKETKILDRPPRDHSIERSNYLPTIQSDVQDARRSTSLSKEIPRATRLSPRISDVAIKDTSAGSNHATHRPDEPATTGSRETARSETIRRGNGLVDLGYPYYGHVGVSSRDEDSQATSTAAGDAAGRRGITWDVNSPEMERSDTKNGLETVSNIEKRDIGSWWRSRDVGKRGEMGEKGYSTMRVNDYVNRVPLVSDKSGLNIDEATGGEKLDRHGLMIRERDGGWRYRLVYDLMNGKRRPGRAVGKFREMLGLDSADLNAPQFFDGSSASNDRFETEIVRQGYRSTGNEGLVYDSASRKSVTGSMAENRDELDGVTSKQRSTMGNDDQRDNGMEYSRAADRNASGISFIETRTFDDNSVGIIYNERAESLLERKINNDEKNIGKGLTFNFIEETVVDNLSLRQKFNTSLSDGTGAMLKINSPMLNNTDGLLESQINVGPIDTIKIDDTLNNKAIVRSELYENKTEMHPNSLRFEGPSNLISLDASEGTVDNRNLTKPIRDREWQANLSSNHYSQLKMNIPTTNNSSQNWNRNETTFNKVKLSNSSNDQKFPSNISYDDNHSRLKTNFSVSITETSYISSNINKTSANINQTSISLNKTELVSIDPNKNAPQTQASVLISKNATNTGILRAKNDSINVTNTKTVSGTNKNDSQIPASIPILSNESKTKIFHLAKHLPEEIELEDSRSRIDGDQEEANRDPREDRSVLSNVTKGEGNILANSPRGSIAVPRNSTYPSHDMNTLAERRFSSQSKDLAQYDERNADDPFRNSSTTIQRRIAESSKIITNPRQPLMNKNDPSESKHLFPSSEKSRDMSSLKEAKELRKIDGGINQWIGSKDLKTEHYEAGLNGSLIVRKDGNADDLRPRASLSENGADEIKANEPAVRFSVKNAGDQAVRGNSSDNGTGNEVNPGRENKESNDDPADRPSEDSNPSKVVAGPDGRSPKERTSRSSSKARMTASSLIQGRNMKIEGLLADKTSTSMWRKGDIPSSGNLSRKNDSTSPGVDEDTLGVHGKSPLNPRDRSTASTMTNGTAKILKELFSNENVTGVSLESVTSINDDEYQSFVFDASFVATSLEPNDEESHGTIVDSVDSHGTDNSTHELEPLDQWPVKHSAVVEGDLVLGGLMMVHEREDTITCGPVMPQGGVQALEAMLYTLDMLNEREIVPGVKIGAHILDDCDKDTYGLEMAVDFIKGSISNIDGAEYHCNKTAVRKVISGVVGAASSVTSIQVANLLRLFRIPQVSFFSTSPELSNKQRFEYFTRTIPSDHYQVKAMVDIVLTMGWSYVSIIYEESNYGIKAFEELEELLGKYDICIAIKEKLVKDSGVAEETAYDNIVLKLLTKPRARGCIIFGSDQEVAGVMRAVRRCNATGAFSWIGSDGWSARGLVSNGNEPEVEGTLSVQPQANPVKGFEEYFLNLTVENNRRNPWFVEFWEDHFQCRYPNASRTPYNQKYTKPCTTKERLTKQATAFEDQLQFVSDAVMAFAYAFRDMHRDLCHGKPGLCDAMKPTKGTELLKYLRKVDFEGLSGDKFKFDKNGDGPARYNIIHFKQVEPGKYKWIRVGKYLEGELRLNMSEIQFKLGHPQSPESVCSLPCEVGQAKKYVEGERCCWHCFNCTQYQIRHPIDETQCIPCRQGTVPDETHSTCRDIPEEFLRPESGWAIGAMSFSATGILITFFVCGVFLKHNDTPVVRASGRELSYVLLSGILLCYLVTFALVLRPTDIVCGIQRFTAGFCFTVVYAALLTKTNRISRIFNASKHSAKRPSFISPRSQLIICSGLVFVQILINGVWMIIDPARAMHHYPTREDNLLVCNSYVDASYMIVFAYPIMLIVVCTVYAVLTRKIPEAFNESKHIGFTMYTTCVIWLAFVPLYFGTGSNVALRITSMSVTISLSASVTIACLFSPKLYIILIRPERNVRQSMMPARYGTTKSSAVTATNASSMIAPVTLTAATCDQNKAVKRHIITTIDCSTQSEYYELEVKDQKNGKPPPTVVSRSTQTSNNNDKDSSAVATSIEPKDSTTTTKQLNNNARIGNGPVNQSDVPL